MKKLNILALLVFIAAVVAVFTLDTAVTRSIQSKVMTVLSPFIHTSAAVEDTVSGVVSPGENAADLKREVDRLQVELDRQLIIAQKHAQLLEENEKLRELIGFRKSAPFKMQAARVVKRVTATWWNSVFIDKGLLDGVATDSPVISASGLVGKTGNMTDHMTEVILLTNELCRVSARVDGTQEQGIVEGDRGGLDLRPDLRLKFLKRTALINAGSNVVSTGEGGVFPAGLAIGRVKRFEIKDISGEAVIEPSVDFSNLEFVFVVSRETQPPPEEAAKKP